MSNASIAFSSLPTVPWTLPRLNVMLRTTFVPVEGQPVTMYVSPPT